MGDEEEGEEEEEGVDLLPPPATEVIISGMAPGLGWEVRPGQGCVGVQRALAAEPSSGEASFPPRPGCPGHPVCIFYFLPETSITGKLAGLVCLPKHHLDKLSLPYRLKDPVLEAELGSQGK